MGVILGFKLGAQLGISAPREHACPALSEEAFDAGRNDEAEGS